MNVEWREEDGTLRPYVNGEVAVWAPQPGSQEKFMECPLFEVLLHGPRGCGKTDVLIMDFCQHVGRGYGREWQGLLLRQSYPQLADVIKKTKKWLPRIWPAACYNEAKSRWAWPTGEELKFGHMATEDDYWNWHGSSLTWLGWEELTTWSTDKCYKVMMSLVRSPHPNIPRKVRATTNPYGCVPHGEVLTSKGWVDIRKVDAGDMVVSFDRYGVASLSRVESRTERHHKGLMVRRQGRGIDMSFTENHRMPLLSTDGERNQLRSYQDLPGQACLLASVMDWCGEELSSWSIPGCHRYEGRKRRVTQPTTLTGMDYAALMGWYLSEGHTTARDKMFSISQTKFDTRQRLQSLLDSVGFRYREMDRGFNVSSHEWGSYLSQFGHSHEKFVPREILNAGTATLRSFFDAVIDGDGSWVGDSAAFYSTSRQLRDDVAEVAVKLGYRVSFSERQRPPSCIGNRPKPSPRRKCYEMLASPGRPIQLHTGNHVYNVSTSTRSVNVTKEHFEGTVYCLVVPGDQSFVIRQGKNVWLSGNSGHSWVKRRFGLGGDDPMVSPVIQDDERSPKRVAIKSTLEENRVLLAADPDYIEKVKQSARSPAELLAWTTGSWDIVAGGMFDDLWRSAVHVVPDIPLTAIPKRWKINRSYDHGQSKPFSVGWWAESNGEPITVDGRTLGTIRGDLFRIAEWYGCTGEPDEGLRMLSTEIADGIRDREERWGLTGRVRPGPADASIYDNYEPGKSVAGDMARRGVRWQAADKGRGSRVQGWQQIRARLSGAVPDHEGMREHPGIYFCRRCEDAIRLLPVTPRDEKNLDDVETRCEDHLQDEVRYRTRAKIRSAKSWNW
jgi:hypothetical protein